ncbi:MAG: hypothetical protein IKV63_08085 [Clostridia bacterium]|nr:hypothetical protein [Clostridia bacterium]
MMNKTLFKKWGKVIIVGVILICIGIYIYEMPRETDMHSALLDGIETHMGIKAKDIEWENIDFPLTSKDNKNWIASNKSPQAVEDTVRNKLEGFNVIEKGETIFTTGFWDLWIHINEGKSVYVKINEDNIIAYYGTQVAIEYEIK